MLDNAEVRSWDPAAVALCGDLWLGFHQAVRGRAAQGGGAALSFGSEL